MKLFHLHALYHILLNLVKHTVGMNLFRLIPDILRHSQRTRTPFLKQKMKVQIRSKMEWFSFKCPQLGGNCLSQMSYFVFLEILGYSGFLQGFPKKMGCGVVHLMLKKFHGISFNFFNISTLGMNLLIKAKICLSVWCLDGSQLPWHQGGR